MKEFHQVAVTPDAVAQIVLFVISQTENAGISEMTIISIVQP